VLSCAVCLLHAGCVQADSVQYRNMPDMRLVQDGNDRLACQLAASRRHAGRDERVTLLRCSAVSVLVSAFCCFAR